MRRFAIGFGALVTLVALAPRSEAHFILQTPASWMPQDSLGIPEKLGPCGDEDDGTMTPTGIVTAFRVGDTITVTIQEVIFHPGHYRISLGDPDRDALPPEPPVEAGATPCGSVPIEMPAVYPVLADNVFPHTTAFTSPQTTTVTLPAGMTCTKCTLQVIEFMSDHPLNNPGGCFYHHCADISISPADAGLPDSGIPVDTDSGNPPPDAATGGENGSMPSGGCGCTAAGASGPALAFGAFLLAGLLARARRRLPAKTSRRA